MSTHHDFDDFVRAWLRPGSRTLSDRVRETALTRIPTIPQRRVSPPAWRTHLMRNAIAIATATAAITVAVFGISGPIRVDFQGSGGPPDPSASPSAYAWPGPLDAGTYATRFVWDAPVEFTFTIPAGWESRDAEIIKDPVARTGEMGGSRGLSVMFLPIGNVYTDPCGHVLAEPPIGPSVDELAAALADLPGVDTSIPTPAGLGGYEGRYLELQVPEDVPCAPGSFFMWDAEDGSIRDFRAGPTVGSTGFYAERPNHRIWVLDVEGVPFLIDAMSAADATAADLAELEAVVESIRIRWTSDPASLGPCRFVLTDPARRTALDDPITITLGPDVFELRGMVPVDQNDEPLVPRPPIAQVDFRATGSGMEPRPGAPRLVGPAGESGGPVAWDEGRRGTGFTTATPVDGYQGSFVFDAPGTWLATIHTGRCFRQFPVVVLPAA